MTIAMFVIKFKIIIMIVIKFRIIITIVINFTIIIIIVTIVIKFTIIVIIFMKVTSYPSLSHNSTARFIQTEVFSVDCTRKQTNKQRA